MQRHTIKLLLSGGLGNQLFQYAFGRALSLRNNACLELDTVTQFVTDHRYLRSYTLDIFSLPPEIKVKDSASRMEKVYKKIIRRWGRNGNIDNRSFVVEGDRERGHFSHVYAEWRLKRSIYLSGYWQSPRYFSDVSGVIKSDLCFRDEPSAHVVDWLTRIRTKRSAAIHVRRNDYWSKLDISYYRKAMQTLRANFGRVDFFVFADDVGWWPMDDEVLGEVTLVDDSRLSDTECFRLMCACDHFVIANSSFSWWAAWLGRHSEKRVVAPSRDIWFEAWDVLLPDWLIIPVEKDAASRIEGATSFNFVSAS